MEKIYFLERMKESFYSILETQGFIAHAVREDDLEIMSYIKDDIKIIFHSNVMNKIHGQITSSKGLLVNIKKLLPYIAKLPEKDGWTYINYESLESALAEISYLLTEFLPIWLESPSEALSHIPKIDLEVAIRKVEARIKEYEMMREKAYKEGDMFRVVGFDRSITANKEHLELLLKKRVSGVM